MPSNKRTSQSESSAEPPQSIRPGDFTGDSGTKKIVTTVAVATAISGNQKSQW
jgi:hypothetical protein